MSAEDKADKVVYFNWFSREKRVTGMTVASPSCLPPLRPACGCRSHCRIMASYILSANYVTTGIWNPKSERDVAVSTRSPVAGPNANDPQLAPINARNALARSIGAGPRILS